MLVGGAPQSPRNAPCLARLTLKEYDQLSLAVLFFLGVVAPNAAHDLVRIGLNGPQLPQLAKGLLEMCIRDRITSVGSRIIAQLIFFITPIRRRASLRFRCGINVLKYRIGWIGKLFNVLTIWLIVFWVLVMCQLPIMEVTDIQDVYKRQTYEGQILGRDQCVSPEEALKAYTIYAAYQHHEDQEHGSLEAGKFADIDVYKRQASYIGMHLATSNHGLKDAKCSQSLVDSLLIYQETTPGNFLCE